MVFALRPFGHTFVVVQASVPLYNQIQFTHRSLRLGRCRKNRPLDNPSCPMREANSTQPSAQSRRRLLSFSIRALFVATLIFAALCAWLGKHVIRTRNERPVVAQVQDAGGVAYYDYQLGLGFVDPSKPPTGAKLVRTVLGDDIYATVNVVLFNNPVADSEIKDLHKLGNLLDVSISGQGVTDECIDDLLRIHKLRCLNLLNTSITPDGLARLSASNTLQHLTLYGASISDAHSQTLPAFTNLQFLQVIRGTGHRYWHQVLAFNQTPSTT